MPDIRMAIAAMTFLCAANATFADAQPPPLPRRPPPEIGVGFTRFFPTFGDFVTEDLSEPSADVRITVPLSRHFAFEAIGTIGQRGNQYWERTEGLFLLHIRQQFRAAENRPLRPFITYGLAGYYAHFEQREIAVPQPGGGSTTLTHVAFNEIEEPAAFAFGGGFQQQLGSRAALRFEGQLLTFLYLPLGYRFSTTVSIPIGRYSTN